MYNITSAIAKKLLYRSCYRGCRETDILLGNFARAELGTLSQKELEEYEMIVDLHDVDLYKWLIGQEELPSCYDTSLMRRIQNYSTLFKGA